jgi:hypothetical protein
MSNVVVSNDIDLFMRSSTASAALSSIGGISASGTTILTNKRITPRIGSTTSSATPTINTDNVDRYDLTAQAVDITSFTDNLSGTPTNGQALWISVKGTAARAITWGASFENGAAALPTTTVSTDRLDVLFVWNAVTSKWRSTLTTAAPATDATKLPLAGGTMDENAIVNLFNGSKFQQSTPDKGIAGTAGFSIICSVGYEYKFANGYLFVLSDNSTTVRKVLYAPVAPTVTDDETLGFTTDTTWEMADGTPYYCLDASTGAAVWSRGQKPVGAYSIGELTGNVTLSLANGGTQYGYMSGNTTFQVPTGTPAECVSEITMTVQWADGAHTLDFHADIQQASDSAATFPKTLAAYKSYVFKLKYIGGAWCLVSLIGGFTEFVD